MLIKIVAFLLILNCNILICFAQSSYPLKSKFTSSADRNPLQWDEYIWSHSQGNAANKPLIDFEAINNWVSVVDISTDLAISPNGDYFAYGIGNYLKRSLDTLVVRAIKNTWEERISNSEPGFFSCDSKQYVFLNKEMGLCFLDLDTRMKKYVKVVDDYKVPRGGQNEWIAFRIQDNKNAVVLLNLLTGKEHLYEGVSEFSFDNTGQWFICRSKHLSSELQIQHLGSGRKKKFEYLINYLLSKDGKKMLLQNNFGLQYINLEDEKNYTIFREVDSVTKVSSCNLDEGGEQVVFSTKCSVKDANSVVDNTIWYWKVGMDKPVIRASNRTGLFNNDLFIQESASFTLDGQCIVIFLQRFPVIRKPTINSGFVNVWSYQDTTLQATQLYNSKQPIVFKALINSETGKLIFKENEFERLYYHYVNDNVLVGNFSLNGQSLKYGDRFWIKDYYKDSIWLVSLKDGSRRFFLSKKIYAHAIKPSSNGYYVVYFDTDAGHYFSYNVRTGKHVDISKGIPSNKLGFQIDKVYWLSGDSNLLVYDDYDIWKLDPTGKKAPLNFTNGYGQLHKILFRVVDEEWEKKGYFGSSFYLNKDTLLLKAFNTKNKFNGFYKKCLNAKGNPELLYMGPYFINFVAGTYDLNGGMSPLKAVNAKTWIIQRQSATEAPNYFVTWDFKSFMSLTNIQPHKKYNWLTAELHNFKRLDGTFAKGILYKPSNFDPSRKYPVIVSFYLTLSDRLYQYPQAQFICAPNLSLWGLAWMVSHDYLVFTPDIQFQKNKWGPSTVNTIDGAAKYLRGLSYVDGKRLGACGHSNSGRFGYYLLTHSNNFAAMSIGSGTADIVSTSLSLQLNGFKESNLKWGEIGSAGSALGNLWQNKESWIDHTAVLQADKVSSPVLMFAASSNIHSHADESGQALEMYISLRRLEKKAWCLQYPQGLHTVDEIDSKDFTVRFTQFFDHYLKSAPAPRWMTRGVPAKLNGIEARYELDPIGRCGWNCKVCKTWNNKVKNMNDE